MKNGHNNLVRKADDEQRLSSNLFLIKINHLYIIEKINES